MGDGVGQKPTWRDSVLVGGFKRIDLLATLTTVGVLRDLEGWDSMSWGTRLCLLGHQFPFMDKDLPPLVHLSERR